MKAISRDLWANTKTGELYQIAGSVTDKNGGAIDGIEQVLYFNIADHKKLYCRTTEDFNDHFSLCREVQTK